MTARIVMLVAVVAVVMAAGIGARVWAQWRRQRIVESVHLDAETSGFARILSFYGPSCDACDRQKAVLAELASARPGALTVELRDASADYDAARQFGLLIVPTTVVISADGTIAAINSGFTARPIIEAQLAAA